MSALEIRGAGPGLLDTPLGMRVRGSGGQDVRWRARYKDDDGRIWRANALSSEDLHRFWSPAKRTATGIAALQSLRPVRMEIRVELEDGRGASLTLERRLLADGVKVRRWKDDTTATLFRPAEPTGVQLLIDAGTAGADHAAFAGALLASRGAVVLAVFAGLDAAREQFAALAPDPVVLAGDDVPVPPGVGVAEEDDAAPRLQAWADLRVRLGL